MTLTVAVADEVIVEDELKHGCWTAPPFLFCFCCWWTPANWKRVTTVCEMRPPTSLRPPPPPPPSLDFPLKFCLLYEGIRRKLKPKMKLSATYSPIYLTGVLPQLITINIFHFCFFCFCCMHFCKKKLIIIKMISCNVEVIWSVIDCWPCIMQESQNIHN